MPLSPRRPLRTLRGLSRPAPVVGVLITVLALGGAVAATYGTGVVLGSRLAPAPEQVPSATVDPPTGPADGAGSGATAPSSASLPDRVAGRTAPADRATTPDRGRSGTGRTSGAEADEAIDIAGPYRAVWPYATWAEVLDHVDRRDPTFATPERTALRFAREVVGAVEPRLGTLRVAEGEARVEVVTPRGSSTVVLARPDLGEVTPVPWGVVSATGRDLAVSADAAGGEQVTAQVRGGTAVVGLHDRVGWRGVALAAPEGAATVRVGPGRTGPAALVALAGDPRDPSAFAVERVDLGPGAPAPVPPSDAGVAAGQLAIDVAAGDLTGVWARLGDPAMAAVTDWRGLAARWHALAARVAPFAAGGLDVTTVGATDPVAIVATRAGGLAGAHALAFVDRGGARALASLADAPASWSTTDGAPPVLVVTSQPRPTAVVVDGVLLPAEPAADGAVRVPLTDLAAGPHVVVALLQDDGVAVAATTITTATTEEAPVERPPSTTVPTPPTPTTPPERSTTTGPAGPPSTPTTAPA